MRRMARLDTRELSSQEFQLAVLTALEEVTAQQQRTRRTLDRLLRRENREAVRHLLDQAEADTESAETGELENFYSKLGRSQGFVFSVYIKNSNYNIWKHFKAIYFLKTNTRQPCDKSPQKTYFILKIFSAQCIRNGKLLEIVFSRKGIKLLYIPDNSASFYTRSII